MTYKFITLNNQINQLSKQLDDLIDGINDLESLFDEIEIAKLICQAEKKFANKWENAQQHQARLKFTEVIHPIENDIEQKYAIIFDELNAQRQIEWFTKCKADNLRKHIDQWNDRFNNDLVQNASDELSISWQFDRYKARKITIYTEYAQRQAIIDSFYNKTIDSGEHEY